MASPFRRFISNYWSFWPRELFSPIPGVQPKRRGSDYLIFAILFVFAAVTNTTYLHNQLWQDELYTLDKFVLVPIKTTLTDYHVVNNHIVFNLLNNIYLRLIGVSDLQTLLEKPEIIRALPYTYTLLGISLFYFLLRKIVGPSFANVALVCYVTTLQVFTFGAQVRGYSLQLLLTTLNLLLILQYRKTPKRWLLFPIGLTGFLLMLNLPSTLYYYLGLMTVLAMAAWSDNQRQLNRQLFNTPSFKLWMAMLTGLLLTATYFLCLVPLHQLTGNHQFYPLNYSWFTILRQPLSTTWRILDFRYLMLIPIMFSLVRIYKKETSHRLSVFLFGSLLLPFLFYALHRPELILRMWLPLIPVFCLLIAHCAVPVFSWINKYFIGYAAVNIATLLFSLFCLKKKLLQDLQGNFITLDLRYQYHLYGYNGRSIIDTAAAIAIREKAPVIIQEKFDGGIGYYTRGSRLDSISLANQGSQKLVLVTNDTATARSFMETNGLTLMDEGKDNASQSYKWFLFNRAYDQR